MKVLIVDDEELTLMAIANKLSKEGYLTITASDALEALTIIKEEKPDLIILDIMMPNISGLELLNLIRYEFLKSIPAIFISALDQQEIIVSAKGLGANDFIIKPFKMEELLLRVKKLLAEVKEER